MGLQAILEAIDAEAAADVAAIEARADAEIADLRAHAESDAQAVREAVQQTTRRRVAEEVARITHRARLDAAASVRDAREDVAREVLAGVATGLAAARDRPDHPDLLQAWVAEARRGLSEGRRLRMSPADAASLDPDGLEVIPDPEVVAGVILEAPDGRRLANTPEVRLDRAEPWIRRAVGRVMKEIG